MVYPNPERCPSLQTAKGWIHLRRLDDHTVDLPDALLCPAEGFRAKPARGLLRPYQAIRRPLAGTDSFATQIPDGIGETGEVAIATDRLAGGYVKELSTDLGSGPVQWLNHYTSYLRGLQASIEFTRNAKTCKARTGGSRYCGVQGGLHAIGDYPQWDHHPGEDRPTKPLGTIEDPMTVHTDMERQGAVQVSRVATATSLTTTTIPIEVDPDGWGGGTDHGIEEDVGTDATQPEALLPVLYTGLRVETKIEATATDGVMKVTVTLRCTNRHTQEPMDVAVTGAWRIALRMHLVGSARDAYAFDSGSLTTELGATDIGAGPETYEDAGFLYEMSVSDTLRGGVAMGETLIQGGADVGIVKTDVGGQAIGLFAHAAPVGTNAAGGAVSLAGAIRSISWSDRTDLTGDDTAGNKHHFLGIAVDVDSPTTIPATVVATFYITVGVDQDEVATRFNAIP